MYCKQLRFFLVSLLFSLMLFFGCLIPSADQTPPPYPAYGPSSAYPTSTSASTKPKTPPQPAVGTSRVCVSHWKNMTFTTYIKQEPMGLAMRTDTNSTTPSQNTKVIVVPPSETAYMWLNRTQKACVDKMTGKKCEWINLNALSSSMNKTTHFSNKNMMNTTALPTYQCHEAWVPDSLFVPAHKCTINATVAAKCIFSQPSMNLNKTLHNTTVAK